MPRVIFNICIFLANLLSGLETAFFKEFFVQRTFYGFGVQILYLKAYTIPYDLYFLVRFYINRVSVNVSVESKANISDEIKSIKKTTSLKISLYFYISILI